MRGQRAWWAWLACFIAAVSEYLADHWSARDSGKSYAQIGHAYPRSWSVVNWLYTLAASACANADKLVHGVVVLKELARAPHPFSREPPRLSSCLSSPLKSSLPLTGRPFESRLGLRPQLTAGPYLPRYVPTLMPSLSAPWSS
jgi:hypothetical protein